MDDTKQKTNKNRKTIWIVVLVILLLVCLFAASIPLYSKFKEIKEQELPEGYQTFNASRYFFRFDRPSLWIISNDSNGFLLNDDTGLVCTMNPTFISPDNDEESVFYDSLTFAFYYREVENYQYTNPSYDQIITEFKNDISDGILIPGVSGNVTFGVLDMENVENNYNELMAVEFSSLIDDGFLRGTMYVAKRTKAYYCVLVYYTDAGIYSKFSEDVLNVVKSFRMTVLQD